MLTRRMSVCLISGAALGIICIAGALIRSGFQSDAYFLLSLWYNRLILGLVIGANWRTLGLLKRLGRGALMGLAISFAFYSSIGFSDHISFLAGIVYGIIIEYTAFRLAPDK